MSKFEVDMSVLIIGCRTDAGLNDIGKVVVIKQLLEHGDLIEKDFTTQGFELRSGTPSFKPSAIVSGNLKNRGRIKDGFAHFLLEHLMPIPKLDDDVLEQTNVKQLEGEKV